MPTVELSDRAKAAIRGALVQKGPHRGRLLRQCPRSGTDAEAAWQALEASANPYKVSVGRLLFMAADSRELFLEIDRYLSATRTDVRGLDSDRSALEALGAW